MLEFRFNNPVPNIEQKFLQGFDPSLATLYVDEEICEYLGYPVANYHKVKDYLLEFLKIKPELFNPNDSIYLIKTFSELHAYDEVFDQNVILFAFRNGEKEGKVLHIRFTCRAGILRTSKFSWSADLYNIDKGLRHPHVSATGFFCTYHDRREALADAIYNLDLTSIIIEATAMFNTITYSDVYNSYGDPPNENEPEEESYCVVCNEVVRDDDPNALNCDNSSAVVHMTCNSDTAAIQKVRLDTLDRLSTITLCERCIPEFTHQRTITKNGNLSLDSWLLREEHNPVGANCVLCDEAIDTLNEPDSWIGFDRLLGKFITKVDASSYVICLDCYIKWVKENPQWGNIHLQMNPHHALHLEEVEGDYSSVTGCSYVTTNAVLAINDALIENGRTCERTAESIFNRLADHNLPIIFKGNSANGSSGMCHSFVYSTIYVPEHLNIKSKDIKIQSSLDYVHSAPTKDFLQRLTDV